MATQSIEIRDPKAFSKKQRYKARRDMRKWSREVWIEVRDFPQELTDINKIRHEYTNYEDLVRQIEGFHRGYTAEAIAYWNIKDRINGMIHSRLVKRGKI